MNGMPSPGELVHTPLGELVVLKQLGKGKSGYSFLVRTEAEEGLIFKVMHDEPCPYYAFDGNKVELEVHAYHTLNKIGIPIPKLLCHDSERNYLVKEFVDGPTAAEWLIDGGNADTIMAQVFEIAHRARQRGMNIDYFPTNFALNDGKLYYVDYEFNPYDEQWNLENWGLYYWANADGLRILFETGDPAAINERADSGIPIKAPFREQVANWIKEFTR